MPNLPLNFIKGDKIGDETDYRDALPENMYGVHRPMFGAQGYMVQHPGLRRYGLIAGDSRGAVWNDRKRDHYRVAGAQFLVIDENGVSQLFGEILETGPVAMPYSFNTQAVIGGGEFFLFSTETGFNKVTDPDVGVPIDGEWASGLYVLTDGEFLYHTELDDETSIEPIKFDSAEFLPDGIKGLALSQDNTLIVFGGLSTEYFRFNPNTTGFLFQRIELKALKIGLTATHAKVELNERWYIMGRHEEGSIGIYVIGVGSTKLVSTREIDKAIAEHTEDELANTVLEARIENGYSFLILHLPNRTFLFNKTLAEKIGLEKGGLDNAWSILSTGVASDRRWRGIHGIFEPRLGKWVYGDREVNLIAILDEKITTHFDEKTEWVLHTPLIYLDSASLDEVEIEILPGHTVSEDAVIFLSITRDGVTHGPDAIQMTGQPGEFTKRFILWALGYINGKFSIKLRGSSESRTAISRGFIRYG